MADNLVLSEIVISADEWVWDDQFGYTATIEKKFSFIADETYRIVCNGAPNEASVAHDISELVGFDMVAVGDMGALGLPANTGKYILGDGGTYNMFLLTSVPQSNPPGEYKFSIYHVTEDVPEEPETPEGIILKDRDGVEVAFYGKETVTLCTTNGGQQAFTKGVAAPTREIAVNFGEGDMTITAEKGTLIKELILKKPDALDPGNIRAGKNVAGVDGEFIGDTEVITVDLNMADGDQIIVPSALGKVISRVTVKKPEALDPGNIRAGENVAGIVGAFACEKAIVKSGEFTGNGGVMTISHGLGVTPDIFILRTKTNNTAFRYLDTVCGLSTALAELFAFTPQIYTYRSSNGNIYSASWTRAIDYNSSDAPAKNATAEQITVGTTAYVLYSGFTYVWIAIGGLTE